MSSHHACLYVSAHVVRERIVREVDRLFGVVMARAMTYDICHTEPLRLADKHVTPADMASV